MSDQMQIEYAAKDAPRLTEHERLLGAERELEHLARLAELADEKARDVPAFDRLGGCNWPALWRALGRPYRDSDAFKKAMALVPGPKWVRFLEIHREDRGVFRSLLALARESKIKRGHFGIGFLAELLRWVKDPGQGKSEDDEPDPIETVDEPWTVNNTWRAYYSRLLALFDPDLQTIFGFRQMGRGK